MTREEKIAAMFELFPKMSYAEITRRVDSNERPEQPDRPRSPRYAAIDWDQFAVDTSYRYGVRGLPDDRPPPEPVRTLTTMNEQKKAPTHRIVFTDKNSKAKTAVGTLWANDRNSALSFMPERGYKDRQGVRLVEVTLDDGTVISSDGCFIDVWPNEPR